MNIPGIHHVTAIARDPQKNIDFYCGVLGLRLVKQTVNFDDPGTYHLYYGDRAGTPGSILTFFPWLDVPQGRRGVGQAVAVAFETSDKALDDWKSRLTAIGMDVVGPIERFGERVIAFSDPDDLRLEIVGGGKDRGDIVGFHSVTLSSSGFEATAKLLTETFGFQAAQTEGNRFRYTAAGGERGRTVDLFCQPDAPRGLVAAGSIHHVAFRAETEEVQVTDRAELARAGYNVTPVLDRKYFRSIYFREPGGVLFEVATDPPGFAVDESPDELGHTLKLPPDLEFERREIEAILPKLRVPPYPYAA